MSVIYVYHTGFATWMTRGHCVTMGSDVIVEYAVAQLPWPYSCKNGPTGNSGLDNSMQEWPMDHISAAMIYMIWCVKNTLWAHWCLPVCPVFPRRLATCMTVATYYCYSYCHCSYYCYSMALPLPGWTNLILMLWYTDHPGLRRTRAAPKGALHRQG